MPLKRAEQRAAADRRAGRPASTQAGEYVREEMHRIGKGGRAPRSRQQAVAIGLSEARRAGVSLSAPKKAKAAKKLLPAA